VKARASGLRGRSSKSVLPFATRLAILFFASYTVFAQTDAPVPAAAAGVLLVKLSAPVYPRLARQARIMGDVRIQLAIRRDGSIESSEVVSGHPLLKQAALESAQQSEFECRGCSDEVNSYSLNYTFGLRDDNACRPVVDKRRVRSLKCLYLWKCGVLLTSTWPQPPNIAPEVTRSQNHVTILASTACVEPLSSIY
jgi:TonB family protein